MRPTTPAGFASAFSSRRYDGEIAFTDFQLGRLLRAVRERWGETGLLVVVTSDHGESFGEHGDLTHSYLVYETTQHVPLLFAGPGIPAGRIVAAPVGLVDVAPTLISLARASPLPTAAGRDQAVAQGRAVHRPDACSSARPQLDFGWAAARPARGPQVHRARGRGSRPRPTPEKSAVAARRRSWSLAGCGARDRLRESPGRAAAPLDVTPADNEALALGCLPAAAASALHWAGRGDPRTARGDRRVRRAQVSMAEAGRIERSCGCAPSAKSAPRWPGCARRRPWRRRLGLRERDLEQPWPRCRAGDFRNLLARALDAQGRSEEATASCGSCPEPAAAAIALRLAAATRRTGRRGIA
jgi:hypothetical protein